jgi:thymidine phosphorylase
MHAVEVIIAKRDGSELSREQIEWVIDAYTNERIPDEQMASLLMAIFWRGMTPVELDIWTTAMRPTVDKHSTGGVGDKISLPLCPLVAACGAAVPQLSGRGLGITGGTLDKMESIPGWNMKLSNDAMVRQLEELGVVICAAGDKLAPADKKLYALRDVVGCIESIPLISSSIMSKKIAEGTKALVLDVKVGSGAFMKDEARARELAKTMVSIGNLSGVKTVAMLTQMDTPLGFTAGNSLEVEESIEVLQGKGPSDVRELTLRLAEEMLVLAGIDISKPEHNPEKVLDSGKAFEVWEEMVSAQGGDPDAKLPTAEHHTQLFAETSGVVTRLDAYDIGVAAWKLGAGRARKEDAVSPGAGVRWHKKEGDAVKAGELLFDIYTDDQHKIAEASKHCGTAVTIGTEVTKVRPLIIDKVTG